MKYENKMDKVKITVDQLLELFDNNIIDIHFKVFKTNKKITKCTKTSIPACLSNKYVEEFNINYIRSLSEYSYSGKIELVIYLPIFIEC